MNLVDRIRSWFGTKPLTPEELAAQAEAERLADENETQRVEERVSNREILGR
jgi:hypothetical protein